MKILRTFDDKDIVINQETDFQTNLGWEENLEEFEKEVLYSIVNPIENYETIRYIHSPYLSSSNVNQTDIWFYFYFYSGNTTGGTYTQDYSVTGLTPKENALLFNKTSGSFFRLEFYKTPGVVSGNTLTCEPPTRRNRKFVFAKNLSVPLGEKLYYTILKDYISVPVFTGTNYRNKENMYLFWFKDESVFDETNLSGTTTGNTFFMTAKYYNTIDGSIVDFTNNTGYTEVTEYKDMYYQIDINKTNHSYQIFRYNNAEQGNRIGESGDPIIFYEKRDV